MDINVKRKAMSLVEIILNPIIPRPSDRDKFFRFLKIVRDTDEPMVCVITGKGNTGKSTLVQLIKIVIGRENCSHIPPEFTTSWGVFDMKLCGSDFKLGVVSADGDEALKCLNGVGSILTYPAGFDKSHYLVQGDFDFSDANLDHSKCIHIHLDNKVPFLRTQLGRYIGDALEREQEDIRQEIKNILDAFDG